MDTEAICVGVLATTTFALLAGFVRILPSLAAFYS